MHIRVDGCSGANHAFKGEQKSEGAVGELRELASLGRAAFYSVSRRDRDRGMGTGAVLPISIVLVRYPSLAVAAQEHATVVYHSSACRT